MGWDEHKRRRAALKALLDYAEQHPTAGLPYAQVDEVRAVFGDRSDVILALQYQWSQALWSRIELLSAQVRQPSDATALARQAWAQCATANPTLRRLLDTHLDECGRSVAAVREREQLLILAGAVPASRVRRYLTPHVA
jgi:hypothetical protein